MKIKKYTADTMPEIMQIIRKDLGPEAVILQSKEVNRSRFLGLFKKKQIEVVAAIDPDPVPKQKVVKKPVQERVKEVQPQADSNQQKKDGEILSELKNLKKFIEIQSEKTGSGLSPDYELALNHLIEQEVEPKIAEDIINKVSKQLNGNEDVNLNEIIKEMDRVIAEELATYFPSNKPFNKKVVQFVGPTGVGKTTTIAKIAAQLMLENNKKVAFITTDTYRIAAIEQLKTYARILNVPLEVAYSVEDYTNALDKFSSYDVILTDTAGRNFRDDKYIKDLKKMMSGIHDTTAYLVLSLTAKPKDITDIYKQFQEIPLAGVIFTKMDETTQYGSMLNIVMRHKIGIPFITNGQDVPEDLLRPNPEDISKMIAGDRNG